MTDHQPEFRDRRTLPRARPTRIGVNVLFLIPGEVGGTEVYTRQVLRALADVDPYNEYFIFRNRETDAEIVPPRPNFHDCPQPVRARIRPARILYEQSGLLANLARFRIEVLFNCGFTAPLLAWLPMVTVFYDLQYKRFGGNLQRFELLVNQLLLPASARRSAVLVAMSDAVVQDLKLFYPWSAGRIALVPHGVDPDFNAVRERRSTTPASCCHFILAVSTLMAHKNFENLLRAFALFREAHPSYRLVVAGIKGRDTARLETIRGSLGLDHAVRFTGWIPRAELLQLFAEASAFVYASRFEGFGIPVLEALTAGLPTACSRIAPLEEIAGNAACYFNPEDVSDMARALCQVVDDEALRAHLALAGPLRAKRFDSKANASQLVTLFESLVSQR